jgi:maltose/moltooligosaccharide transporter
MNKPRLSFWQIWNMSFGFMGIQFGWGLQMANMSPIYKYLGASDEQIPLLWLAAPLTGFIVQPIIGAMSDRTWGPLGRRRPYFLVGALLSSAALVLMPNCGALWMAAGLLWILDASINVSMEPFRAFVADKLPEEQRGTGFAMQSFFIGVGAVIADLLPWMLRNWFNVTSDTGGANVIPLNVKLAFYIGAVAFLAAILWTIFSTSEYPPEDMDAFLRKKRERASFRVQPAFVVGGLALGMVVGIAQGVLVQHHLTIWHALAGGVIGGVIGTALSGPDVSSALKEMPGTMRQLALVQFFTWLGLFCMWLHFSNAVPVVFGTSDKDSPLFKTGAEWAGVCYAVKDAVTFLAAFALMAAARKLDRRRIHGVCLALGGIGLLSVGFIHGDAQKNLLLVALGLGGVAWASILSMPYAILARALPPERMGVYMGIFNFFIVLPEILAALTFGPLVKHLLGGNLVHAVMAGGVFMIIAALLAQWVQETPTENAA